MGKCNPVTKIIPATCAWIILLFATGLFFAYPCRYLMFAYSIAVPIVQGVITFFVIVNFALATFVNPGVIPKAAPDELKDDNTTTPAYQDIEIKGIRIRLKWCVTCQFYRPPRCVHCGVCDMCIETFDHHCPWVNNCIGRRNYRYFFMFLLWLSVHMVCILSFCIVYIKDHVKYMKEVETIITLTIVSIIIFLFIPILGLTAYHFMLIVQGRTTNEQVTGKFIDGKSPYAKGCCQNILRSLCNSPLPRFHTKSTLYAAINKHPPRTTKGTSTRESHSLMARSEKSAAGNFNAEPTDFLLTKQSQSQDSEASPPSYLNRGRLHLSLSESIYVKQPDSSFKNRGSRALTPPVPIRFDCSRRSLPPHNRFHALSPHYALAQSTQGTVFHTGKDATKMIVCASQGHSPNCSSYTYQPGALYKYEYETHSPECEPMRYYQKSCKRKDLPVKSEGFLYNSSEFPNSGKVLVTDTCCLGNQTVDKLQEIANRTIISGQCTDVSVLEAFPKGCSNFHNSPSKVRHDVSQLLTAQTPQQMFINNSCVDCQPHGSEHSCQINVPNELARTPGNRPLSFVKAMEMSEALDFTNDRPKTVNDYHSYTINSASNDSLSDRRTHKSDHEISYEISV